jgi:hypothetical protein
VLLAIAIFINTSASMKSPFLGGGIYGVWLFGCAYIIGRCAATRCWSFDFRWKTGTLNLLLITALAGAVTYRWPRYSDWGRDRVGAVFYREANERVLNLLEKNRGNLPSSILFMQAGPIIPEYVNLWFSFNGLELESTPAAMLRSAAAFADKYPSYDWIVIQEKGVRGSSPNMPSEAILTEAVKIILGDPNMRVLDVIHDQDMRKLYILENTKPNADNAATRGL